MISAIPRVLGACFLPNAFGDAYVYIRDIGALSTRMRAGTFAIVDLYGFWLPLFQFICAVVNVLAGNGFYSGKLVAAVFGAGVGDSGCVFVGALFPPTQAGKDTVLGPFRLRFQPNPPFDSMNLNIVLHH